MRKSLVSPQTSVTCFFLAGFFLEKFEWFIIKCNLFEREWIVEENFILIFILNRFSKVSSLSYCNNTEKLIKNIPCLKFNEHIKYKKMHLYILIRECIKKIHRIVIVFTQCDIVLVKIKETWKKCVELVNEASWIWIEFLLDRIDFHLIGFYNDTVENVNKRLWICLCCVIEWIVI
jgi:hypothetical protein